MSRQRRLRLLAAGVPIPFPEGLSIGEERDLDARIARERSDGLLQLRALLR